jgi:hypothetical protein
MHYKIVAVHEMDPENPIVTYGEFEPRDQGKAIALRSYVPESVTRTTPETVYANTFAVTLPDAIQVCELERELSDDEEQEIRRGFAYVEASPTKLLAFDNPPSTVPLKESVRLAGYSWKDCEYQHGRYSVDAVKELVRRSLDVVCFRVGLEWCDDRRVFYFPHEVKPQRNVSYVHVDGRRTRVAVTGEQSYGSGERAKPFRYQLCPRFRVGYDESGNWWVVMRVYVRIKYHD